MARTGLRLKRHKAVHELWILSQEFGDAMRQADIKHVASGRATMRMADIWARYVLWAKANEKILV